jgi:H+/Cl- antiporter ClcA
MAQGPAKKHPPPRESPLSDAYLVRRAFWHDLAAAVGLGLLIGAVSFCFLSFVIHVTESWMGVDPGTPEIPDPLYSGFPNNRLGKDVSGYGKGPVWWLAITCGGGLLVGLVKWAIGYPQGKAPSFLQEIQHGHVDPWMGARTAIVGMLSLAAGAAVGPEYPLSSMGGAAATWLAGRLKWPEGRAQSLTLIGMSAALGSIFSTPYLAVLLIIELGGLHPTRNAEAAVLLLTAAAVSFSVFIGCVTTGLT